MPHSRMPPPTQPAPPRPPRPPAPEPDSLPDDLPPAGDAALVGAWPTSAAHERLLNNLQEQPRARPPSLDSTDSLRRSLAERRRRAEATTRTYRREAEEGNTTSLHVALPAAPGPEAGRLRILVIDEDMMRQAAFQQGLTGAIVVAAMNAVTARHLLVLEQWDVVFLDLCQGSEQGNGLHLARFLAERPHQVAEGLLIVHSTDGCGGQMAALLSDAGLRVRQRALAWQEVPLLRRLVREKRWPRQERTSPNGFDPPLVLSLPGY